MNPISEEISKLRARKKDLLEEYRSVSILEKKQTIMQLLNDIDKKLEKLSSEQNAEEKIPGEVCALIDAIIDCCKEETVDSIRSYCEAQRYQLWYEMSWGKYKHKIGSILSLMGKCLIVIGNNDMVMDVVGKITISPYRIGQKYVSEVASKKSFSETNIFIVYVDVSVISDYRMGNFVWIKKKIEERWNDEDWD